MEQTRYPSEDWYGWSVRKLNRAIMGQQIMLSFSSGAELTEFEKNHGRRYVVTGRLQNPTNGRIHVWARKT